MNGCGARLIAPAVAALGRARPRRLLRRVHRDV